MTPRNDVVPPRPTSSRTTSATSSSSSSPPERDEDEVSPPPDGTSSTPSRDEVKHPTCHLCGSPWFDAFDSQLRCCNCNAPYLPTQP